MLQVGDYVIYRGADHTFEGWIVALFPKRAGATRCVVENRDGVLHILDPKRLEKLPEPHASRG